VALLSDVVAGLGWAGLGSKAQACRRLFKAWAWAGLLEINK